MSLRPGNPRPGDLRHFLMHQGHQPAALAITAVETGIGFKFANRIGETGQCIILPLLLGVPAVGHVRHQRPQKSARGTLAHGAFFEHQHPLAALDCMARCPQAKYARTDHNHIRRIAIAITGILNHCRKSLTLFIALPR